jgi:kinesin family protein 5
MMYDTVAKDNVTWLMNGYNVTIFAYGQSGSGKTYTMLGPDEVVQAITSGEGIVPAHVQKLYGIIPRAIYSIFADIQKIQKTSGSHFKLRVNYFEIYNESFNDLLAPNGGSEQNLKLREQKDGSISVTGGTQVTVACPEDIFDLLMIGQRTRQVASTNQNERSSRSHTIFIIEVVQTQSDGSKKQGRFHLVDLAGSERIAKTGATGKTLQEAKQINLSLTTLGLCIKQLTDGSQFVNFRDSKLTYFLKDALGGNSKTTLVCTASKLMKHMEESVQTLKFAQRAKRIKNVAVSNVQKSPKEMEMMIDRLKQEVAMLKSQL